MTEFPLFNLRKRLPNFRIHVDRLMTLTILFLIISVAQSAHPLICNRDTEHQCICEEGPKPPNAPVDCEDLIMAEALPVVNMELRHVNLEAKLHTQDTYENYFKKRVASIVSRYCEDEANECPGVSLKITKNDARMSDENFVLYAIDENEPLLTQDNVILLKVLKEPGNMTRILFVIAKNKNLEKITENDIVDSNMVKVIFGSQKVQLSRILGGIRIDTVRVSRIKKQAPLRADSGDNSKLIWMGSCVGLFFIICYIIGCYKLVKLNREKRNRNKMEKEALAATSVTPNYGTLNTQKISRNGSLSQKHQQLEAAFESEYRSIDETVPEHDPNEPRHITERQARFMFMCDPSQLPREPTFDSTNELDHVAEQKEKTPLSTHEVINEEEEVQQRREPEKSKDMDTIPQLIIVSSMSMSEHSAADSPVTGIPQTDEVVDHLRSESPQIERPTSRRGSRVDEEEIDLTELGASKPMFTDLAIPDGIEPHYDRPDSIEKWSSSEGEVDVYYKMSDDEECKGDDWNATNNNDKITNEPEGESDADNEDEDKPKDEPDAFVYERLREDLSPQPPLNDSSS